MNPPIRFRLAFFLPVLALLACDLARADDDLSVKVGQTVEVTHSRRYCWFPTVHRFAGGELMATIRMSPDETNPEGDFSAVCYSKDGGLTWSHRHTMGAGSNVDGAYSDTPNDDGTIWNLYGWVVLPNPAGQAQRFEATLTKWSAGGRHFTQVRDAIFQLTQPVGFSKTQLYGKDHRDAELTRVPQVNPYGPILKNPDGSWIAPIEFRPEGEKDTQLGVIRSVDNGQTWNQISTIATSHGPDGKRLAWVGDEGPDESSFVHLADGRLYSIFRTGNHGYLGQSWSSDDGKTWTAPTSTGFKGVAPKLRRLSNGVLACTTGRPGPVSIMFSVDGTGKTWSHLTPIFSGMSTRYTDFVELSPGHLLMIYDSVPYSWDPIPEADPTSINRVLATFVDVKRN